MLTRHGKNLKGWLTRYGKFVLTRHGKTIGMKDNYLRHYQMLKIQWLTRYGKFEGMIDSARKNLKGWLTRHGKFKGMVDSARKTCVDSARKI